MKTIGSIILILIYFSDAIIAQNSDRQFIEKQLSEFRDITDEFLIEDFESINDFILKKGDKEGYSNEYNDNPHYSFNGFVAYLNPEIGQLNGNCDTAISDFNELVVRDQDADPQYYYTHIVREGDSENPDIYIYDGMLEEHVYLLNPYDDDIDVIETNLLGYLEEMKQTVLTANKEVNSYHMGNIKIYPNPVNSILYIELPENETYPINYEIITVIGKIQLQGTLNSDLKNTIELDVSMLDKGLYILLLKFGDKSISKIFYKNFF